MLFALSAVVSAVEFAIEHRAQIMAGVQVAGNLVGLAKDLKTLSATPQGQAVVGDAMSIKDKVLEMFHKNGVDYSQIEAIMQEQRSFEDVAKRMDDSSF